MFVFPGGNIIKYTFYNVIYDKLKDSIIYYITVSYKTKEGTAVKLTYSEEVLKRNIKASREEHEFDESIIDSLSDLLKYAIASAAECNIPHMAYYVCKYANKYNDRIIYAILTVLYLSYYKESWIDIMMGRITEFSKKTTNESVVEYIKFLALFPVETAENTLEHCLDFMFENDESRISQYIKEINMDKWELYYYEKRHHLLMEHIYRGEYPYNIKRSFLNAIWNTVSKRMAVLYDLNKKTRKKVSKLFIREVVANNDGTLDTKMLVWYATELDKDSEEYKIYIAYLNKIDPPTLNIELEEVV